MSNTSRPGAHAYLPQSLREYALLADGERGALVGPHGDICWLCVPSWHDGAVFTTLIGGRGQYAVTPQGRFVTGGYYEDGSLVWRSRWITESGVVECREALALPGDPRRAVVLRRILARQGEARVRVIWNPHADYGSEPLRDLAREPDGAWTARTGGLHLRWCGAADAVANPTDTLVLDLVLGEGDEHDLVMEASCDPLRDPPVDARDAWTRTERAWADAVPALADTIAPRDARQAYAVMRGMTSRSGGIVAAATTSLPERAKEGRNYDYRYVWIRDQCYAGQAALAAGLERQAGDAVRFVTDRLQQDGPKLAPAYTVHGGTVPDQRRLELSGYPGGFDQVGNHVNRQFQLDAYGEALLLLANAARHGRSDRDAWQAARIAADTIARRWREPDAGIWELDSRAWTHSRLVCVAGLRALSAAAPDAPRSHQWRALADTILTETADTAVHPDGYWQRAPGDPAPDAALLLPPVRGALAADDPRTGATVRAVRRELGDDYHLYRFRHDDRPLAQAEGAFLLCGFAMALAEHQQGHAVEAYRWFERNRAACGASGLYSEEFDIAQRQLRGNLPQMFVHALLLECATRLAHPPGSHLP